MKTLATFLIAILSIQILEAQSATYKKIMAEKHIVGKDVFFVQLQEYQKINKEYANVYYQLGKVELDNFAGLDPLVDRIASRQYVYNSKTNFSLAKNFLDEKEITKNPEWFDVPDLKEKDSVISLANAMVDTQYEATITYADAYEKLVYHYDKAVTHYLQARQDFIAINNSADNLRQLFLQTDEELKDDIRQVGVSFDSSMYHLNIYRDTYQLLPHSEKRKVIVNYNRIDHFRMNGITPTNFLADVIDVWDYKHWSDDFLHLIEVEVDGLKEEIRNAYQFFTSTNERMMSGDECIQANIDDRKFQRIVNLVTKYDNQSVLIDIFNYLMSKLEYGNQLTYERNCNLFTGLPTDDFLSRKARIYQNLFATFRRADSLNNLILTSGRTQSSFDWFFNELMSGENGSQEFATTQQAENKSAFRNEMLKLSLQSNKQNFKVDSSAQCFSKLDSLLISNINFGIQDTLCIDKKLELTDSLALLIGKDKAEQKIYGVQKDAQGYIIRWEQATYKNGDITYFKTVSDSSFVIGGTSWLKHLSTSGLEKNTIKLKSTDSILNVSYNDLQGSFTIIQAKGQGHTVSTVGFNGKVNYTSAFELPGKFLNVWKREQALWFFTWSSEADKSTITASILDASSNEFGEAITYELTNLIANPILVKNDNESITLLSTNAQAEDEYIYSLLDYLGTVHYEEIF